MKDVPVSVGEILAGKYRVEAVIGAGGMGAVVEATHLELGERRAIKLMLPSALAEGEAVARFMREARAASRLRSEHVAHVHDVGKLPNGAPYMVMEHLEGKDLRRVAKERGRLPVAEVIRYALQVCEGLAEAHAVGIIHRDLKPANLFLTQRTDGTASVKVLDFGVSKMADANELEMTSSHAMLGSPSYMSPEQMRSSRDVDARTDIWALGVVIYRLLTGELPFKGENITEIVTLVLQASPLPPSALAHDLPRALDAVILRCLERDRDRRYASVAELAAALFPFGDADARAAAGRVVRVLASISATGSATGPRPSLASVPMPSLAATPTPLGATVTIPLPPPSHPELTAPALGQASTSGATWESMPPPSATVAVHRWKLWTLVAACGGLAVAFAISLASRGVARDPAPARTLAMIATASPVASSGEPPPRDFARAEPPAATAPASASVAAPEVSAPRSTASSQAPRRVKVAAPAVSAAQPVEPKAPPPAVPLITHRVFGSE